MSPSPSPPGREGEGAPCSPFIYLIPLPHQSFSLGSLNKLTSRRLGILQTRADLQAGEGLLIHPFKLPEAKAQRTASARREPPELAQERSFRHAVFEVGRVQRPAKHSPLENFFCLLLGYLDPQVPQGLHDLLGVDSPCNNRGREREPGPRRARGGQPWLRRQRSPSFFLSKLLNTSLSFFS